MTKPIKAWWFSSGYTLPHGDNRPIAIGTTHTVKDEIIPCRNGLHASTRPLDALLYAPGPILWRVEMSGAVVHHNDKLAASSRTYISGGVDVSETLRKFARRCALDTLHLWDAPKVVVDYLKTGNEDLRDAAWAAAWAAGNAAGDAAWAAARAAAGNAAWAAGNAAWDAARAATGDAAWDAVDAAWDAAWEKQNKRLIAMLTLAIRNGQRP